VWLLPRCAADEKQKNGHDSHLPSLHTGSPLSRMQSSQYCRAITCFSGACDTPFLFPVP
jgi:hypothetical protein